MVTINAKLLKKRSEHHDGLLIDLEEISLHQQGIEKIEYIGLVCKNLRILLLQNNLIAKIENLNKLKDLEYLNLALNKISYIDGLSGCESLRKLDLTVNFIDFDSFTTSLENLRDNYNLEDLYLAGNPVSLDWDTSKYRTFVIGILPQLKQLDGELITMSERIQAQQSLKELKLEVKTLASIRNQNPCPHAYSPEARREMYCDINPSSKEEEVASPKESRHEPTPLLNSKGEIRQCNEGGYEYHFSETVNETGRVLLVFEIGIPKYMDTSLVMVDLNPTYVRCVIKGRVTQVVFDEEIEISSSCICRSKTTGCLKISAPIMGRRPRMQLKDQQSLNESNCDIPPLERI
jgi:protein TilB